MGFIEKVDRPKPWRARYRAPDGRTISKSFRRKADAEKWLLLEEVDVLAGRWHDPNRGPNSSPATARGWLGQRSPTVARKTDYNTLLAVVAALVATVRNTSHYRASQRTAVVAAVTLIFLDASVSITATGIVGSITWPLLVAVTLSTLRAGVTSSRLPVLARAERGLSFVYVLSWPSLTSTSRDTSS